MHIPNRLLLHFIINLKFKFRQVTLSWGKPVRVHHSHGPSKKVRTAVGRSIFAVGGPGRITKAGPERDSQQIAAPGEGKEKPAGLSLRAERPQRANC
jgi:hypothetical protein